MSELLQVKRPKWAAVDAKTFSAALKRVSEVLAKSVIPELSEVCVRFSKGQCVVSGADLTAWVISEFPASGDDFAFIFSRTKDAERICRYFDGILTLTLAENDDPDSGGLVTLSCGARAGEFDTYSAENYLVAPELPGEVSFRTNAAAVLGRVRKVAYATKKPGQNTKELTACVEFSGNQIFAVDGQRAAWTVDNTLTFPQPFLVYGEHLRLLKLFGDSQADFYLSKSYLHVTDGSTTVIFRTVQDAPFNLSSAIPQTYEEEFWVSPKGVLSELKYLNDATPRARTSRVRLCRNELSMTVNGRTYSTAIDMDRQSAQTIMFELRHLTDAFKQFSAEAHVKVKISGSKTPVVIEAEDGNSCALILPVPVKESAAA